MIDRLLNLCDFNLSSYIEEQESIMGEGFYFKIHYKKKIDRININLFSKIFHKNFISFSEDYTEDLINGFTRFCQEEDNYKNNPIIIDPSQKVKIYIQDKIKNPKIKNLVVEEFPNKGKLTKLQYGSIMSPDPGCFSILGSKEDLEVFDSQKFFYLFITNLKTATLPGDFENLMAQVEKDKLNKIDLFIKEKFPEIKSSYDSQVLALETQASLNKFFKEVETLKSLSKIRFFGIREIIAYHFFINKIFFSVDHWRLQKNRQPLNVKKSLSQSYKRAEYYKPISPCNKIFHYRLTKTATNFGLSKIKKID